MEEKLREIVSLFIRVAPGDIRPDTPIDRTAVKNSILLHRMYARLAQEGVVPQDYSTIKVFGHLSALARGNGQPDIPSQNSAIAAATSVTSPGDHASFTAPASLTGDHVSVGIDIEETSALPRTADFRKESFYTLNFSPEEMAYCILQPDPYASFTGLFAVKEAIVKAGGRRRGEPFNTIHILHSGEGKPLYPDFAISISHTSGLAVAVATRSSDTGPHSPIPHIAAPAPANSTSAVAWLALLLGLIALLFSLIHHS